MSALLHWFWMYFGKASYTPGLSLSFIIFFITTSAKKVVSRFKYVWLSVCLAGKWGLAQLNIFQVNLNQHLDPGIFRKDSLTLR